MGKLTSLKPKIARLDTRVGSPVVKRILGRHLQRIRDRVLLRDEFTCQVCGRVSVDLEIDHIVPLALGGRESDANRQSICREPCHRLKSAKEGKER